MTGSYRPVQDRSKGVERTVPMEAIRGTAAAAVMAMVVVAKAPQVVAETGVASRQKVFAGLIAAAAAPFHPIVAVVNSKDQC